MKKIFKKLLLVFLLAGLSFSFSACDDDDDDDASNVTQAQIEKYIGGSWFVDLGDTYFRFLLSTEQNEGNYHYYNKADNYVISVMDFSFSIEGDNLIITPFDSQSPITYKVLSINNKEAKIRGILPNTNTEKTYTFKRNINLNN